MATTRLTGTLIKSGSIPVTALGGGVVTSSAQVAGLIPGGTVSSSAQYPGWVTASSQINYNNIQNKLSGVVSSSTQVQPLLPDGTVSSSGQVDITATTNYSTFSSSLSTVDARQQVSLDALNSATSSYAINATIQSQLAGVASSSSQVKEYLPLGTISASNQIDITATTNYPTFSSSVATKNDTQDISINALNAATSSYALQTQLAGVASSSTQVKTYLPTDTVSSSTQVVAFLPTDTVSSSAQYPGWVTSSTQITQALPTGTVSSSAQYSGWVTASSQIDYNSIQNKLSGVVSSSTQVQPLLPGGTVSSSGQVDVTATTGYSTFSSSLSTVDTNQQTEINALKAVTSSYAINSTIQSQLANVVSSSAQIKPLLPDGTVSSSVLASPSQGTVRLTINGAVTDVDTGLQVGDTPLFTGLDSSGSINLASNGQIRVLNDAESTLFGFYNGSSILGAYYQMWGNNHASPSQRGTAEFVFDTRNSGGAFHIAGFDGATWTRRLTVDRTGLTSITGSLEVVGPLVGSLTGSILSPGVVSSSTQVVQSLPGGTVSASGQVSITATTGYSTFSSSIATKNDTQDISINALNAATSSYAINATIQSQLAGVASSSAQVKAYLPDGTVSSSGQVDYNSITNKLSGVVSSSAQVQPLLPAGTLSSSTQVNAILDADGVFSSSAQVVVQNTTGIGAIATTGSNTFQGNQTISGSLFISQNLTVLGSSSITYLSQSTLNVETNLITVNAQNPSARFGGLAVIDSGSSPLRSGSILFDSVKDEPVFVHQSAGQTSSVFLLGPETYGDLGNEIYLTSNKVPKSQGNEHLIDSQITDNGVTVSITNGLSVGTNLTASSATISGLTANQAVFTDANDTLVSVATTGTGDVVRAGSPTITGTLSATNITATGTMLLAGVYSSSTQVDYNSIQNKLSGVVSSSTQVKPLLPDGTVSSSAQYPGWVTASSQIDYNSITNKLSGVVSSSTQVQPLLPDGTVSSSGQVDITATTNYATFSSSIATKNNLQDVSINALNAATSSYAINSTIQSQLAGVISSSAQTVASIANQTIAPTTVNTTTINASVVTASALTVNQAVFTNASDGLVSNAITGTGNVVMSASPTLTGTITADSITATGTIRLAGIYSSSTQVDYNSIQNKLSGVVSSSAQVQPLLPGGTVSSSAQYPGWVTASGQIDITATTGYSTFSSSIATKNNTQDVSINALNAATSSYAINSTIQSQLAGVISSSAQTVSSIANQTIAPTTVNATSILSGSVLQTSNHALIGGKLAVTGAAEITGTVTASNLNANQAVFTNASDGLVSNAITGTGNVVMSASPTLTGTVTAANITATGTMLLAGIVSQSSQIDYNSITNKLSGVVSSSGQVQPLLPAGTVSSSTQFKTITDPFTGSFTGSFAGTHTGTFPYASLTGTPTLVSASSQIDYNSITNKLSGVVSSSAQIQPLLPGGTVSSSAQYPGWVTASSQVLLNSVAGTTFSNNSFYFPIDLRVEGNLTAQQIYTEYVSSSVIYESGSSKFGDTTDDVMSVTGSILVLGGRISGSMTGMFSASSQVDYNSITNKLSGVVSSSAQVQPLLPGGTVSSSAQYPGWVTASSQIDYNSITNKLAGVYSSSTQAVAAIASQTIAPATVNATSILSGSVVQTGTNALIGGKLAVTGSTELTGTVTASNLTANQAVFTNASDGLVSNAITGTGNVVMSASPTLTGTVTAANITANGTLLLQNIVSQSSSPSFTGLNSTGTITLQGIVSQSSAPSFTGLTSTGTVLLAGIISSSTASTTGQGNVRVTVNGANTDVSITNLDTSGRPLFSGSQFSGIVSGSGLAYRLVVPVGTNYYAT